MQQGCCSLLSNKEEMTMLIQKKLNRRLNQIKAKQVEQGFTLIELVIVIGIIAMLAGLSILAYDGSRGQGVALYSKLTQYGDSLKRMKFDTQCYPTQTGALFNRTMANDSHCGIDLQPNWKGPYTQSTQTDTNNNISLAEYTDSAALILPEPAGSNGTGDINGSGNRTQWTIIANNIPAEIVNVVMEECNNGYESGSDTIFKQGQCFITGAAAGDASTPTYEYLTDQQLYSVGYVFDERA